MNTDKIYFLYALFGILNSCLATSTMIVLFDSGFGIDANLVNFPNM
jgi:hypothetical protein